MDIRRLKAARRRAEHNKFFDMAPQSSPTCSEEVENDAPLAQDIEVAIDALLNQDLVKPGSKRIQFTLGSKKGNPIFGDRTGEFVNAGRLRYWVPQAQAYIVENFNTKELFLLGAEFIICPVRPSPLETPWIGSRRTQRGLLVHSLIAPIGKRVMCEVSSVESREWGTLAEATVEWHFQNPDPKGWALFLLRIPQAGDHWSQGWSICTSRDFSVIERSHVF